MNLMDGWPVDVGALHFQQLDHAIHDRAFMNSQPGVTCEPPTCCAHRQVLSGSH
jgi:hypothetical protein